MSETTVSVRELVKSYGNPAAPVHALRGVSLTVLRGEKVALLGKSGSGKSTLLNLIGGLDLPTSGTIEVQGRDLGRMSRNDLAQHRLATVGMIFQSFNLIASRTAMENVELPMMFAARPAAERRSTARQALAAVGLERRLDHRPHELSGGEHQRVAIARALVNRPRILLADEPTGNLDSATAGEIIDLLIDHLRRLEATLILVTHDEELARRCADRIVWLKDGQIVE
ncbi:MAG TPA: ABC transporter ATP-binding protein [Gemmataceae bacterium]|jgi:predicted ABC-type transport system involved in lysophospholipase L1 biosynthesis ATPase subunit